MTVPETFFSIQEEVFLFLFSCIAGIIIGVFYDIFRTIRIIIPHNAFFTMIEDIVFLAGYAVFLSSFASAQARGELRFYFILGNALGFIVYFFTAGTFVIRTMKKFFGFLGTVFSPVKAVYVIFRQKTKGKFVKNYNLFINHIKKINFHLQNDKHLVYNIKESKKRKNVNAVAEKEKRKNKKGKNKKDKR